MSDDMLSPIASRGEFHGAIRSAIGRAAQSGATEIVMVDPTFDDWPLHERGVVDLLTSWVTSQRRLVLYGARFEALARAPRFVAWRRQWAHVVQCRSDDEIEAEQVPTLLLVPETVCVRLLDTVRHRGIVSSTPIDLVACREEIDALLQRSVEAFPATTLGL